MAGKGIFVKLNALLGVLIFVLLIIMSCVWKVTAFVPEIIIFIAVILFFYITYNNWNLNLPVYTIIILSFIPHSLGFMGFYLNSPIPIAWD
ncbi:hypothetical protein KY314_03565, partial [Candidatus Woesearchaeota archaeon]|nr:hypothetical protein [Candidatus Woesearchaeota archaeon]